MEGDPLKAGSDRVKREIISSSEAAWNIEIIYVM